MGGTAPGGTVAVIGDVAGHTAQLRQDLEGLGVRFDAGARAGRDWLSVGMDWPPGPHVVQVGDLVHRGPDSLGAVLLADRLMRIGVWTQVAGNHEQLYVDRPVFQWSERIDEAAVALLRTWWREGRMVPAAMIETAGGHGWLATHAGLTAGFWRHGLGRPVSTSDLLGAIGEARDDGALWHPGRMLTGRVDQSAGPVWAEAGTETYPSWLDADEPMPVSQVHGHSSAYWWDRGTWQCADRLRPLLAADARQRHVTFTVPSPGTGEDVRAEQSHPVDRRIVGIDPGHGAHPAPAHAPFVLETGTVRVA